MEDTPDLFNRIAHHYDWWSTLLSADGIQAWHRAAIQWLELEPGQRVLDVGCGTGRATREMAVAVGRQGEVVGLDPADGMLAQARGLTVPVHAAPIQWVKGRAEALPFDDQKFDRVTAQFSLRNAQDWQAAVGELWRVTKPGGRLVILDVVQPVTTWGTVAWRGLQWAVETVPHTPYRWLADSVRQAPTVRDWLHALTDHGWDQAQSQTWLGDLVALFAATRRPDPPTTTRQQPAVVWAIDGSAVAYQGAEWIWTHVVPQTPVHLVTVVPPHTPVADTARTVAWHHIYHARQRLAGWSPVITAVRAGAVAEELARYAKSVRATALLLGYKARPLTAERIFGGVWADLWAKTPCPLVALLDGPVRQTTPRDA